MSRFSWIATLGVVLAVSVLSNPALAQGIYGVSSGLILEGQADLTFATCPPTACCTVTGAGSSLFISEGTYIIAGTPYALSPSAAMAETYYTGGTVDGGSCGISAPVDGGLLPDTAYYCYETTTPSLKCSLTPPWPNGVPSVDAGPGSQSMIFVGSFLTDNSKNVIPFKRIGEQVLLKPMATQTTYIDAGVDGHNYTFTGGVSTCGWPYAGGSATNCRNLAGAATSPDTFEPFYPVTASAGLFDIHVLNTLQQSLGSGSNPQLVQFYDATSYYTKPIAESSVQAEIAVGGAINNSLPELVTIRETLNCNQIPPPYDQEYILGTIQHLGSLKIEPSYPSGDYVMAVLRGYIEPIQRLYSR